MEPGRDKNYVIDSDMWPRHIPSISPRWKLGKGSAWWDWEHDKWPQWVFWSVPHLKEGSDCSGGWGNADQIKAQGSWGNFWTPPLLSCWTGIGTGIGNERVFARRAWFNSTPLFMWKEAFQGLLSGQWCNETRWLRHRCQELTLYYSATFYVIIMFHEGSKGCTVKCPIKVPAVKPGIMQQSCRLRSRYHPHSPLTLCTISIHK